MTGEAIAHHSFQILCRKAINKAIAIRKTGLEKMRGESPTRRLAAENFATNSRSPDHVEFMNALFEIQFGYVPKKYCGRVLVYAAKAQWITHLLQMEAAWRKVAPDSKIVYVKGNHITMMRSPDGSATAKHLSERIAEIESPSEFVP